MGKYSEDELHRLIENLDALDVLEFLDYHPESIQRDGDTVHAYCPLCQDLTDRYLMIDLKTKYFKSEPPHMPTQMGNLLDLVARARATSLDQAATDLAEEFGIHLVGDTGSSDGVVLLTEAETFLRDAEAPGPARQVKLSEAEKRYLRILRTEPENRDALRGILRIRLIERNPLTLALAVRRLVEIEKRERDYAAAAEVAREYLGASPNDTAIRRELAEILRLGGRPDESIAEWLRSADIALESSQENEAIDALRRARSVSGDHLGAHKRLVDLMLKRGLRDEARKEIQTRVDWLKAKGRYQEASKEAARKLRINGGDDDTRIQVIELAILAGLTAEDLKHCLNMVEEMTTAGRLEKAAEALSYLVGERPSDTAILGLLIRIQTKLGQEEVATELSYRLSDLYCEKGDLAAATAILNERLDTGPRTGRAVDSLAQVRAAAGNTAQAVVLLREAIDLYLEEFEEGAALAAVQKICELAPTEWGDREREVELLWATGRVEESEVRMETLLADLRAAGESTRQEPLLRAHLERDPSHLPSITALHALLASRGDLPGCAALRAEAQATLSAIGRQAELEHWLGTLVARDSNDLAVREEQARLLLRLGRRNDARVAFLELASMMAKHREHARAAALLDEVAHEFPTDLPVVEALCDALLASGDMDNFLIAAEHQIELLIVSANFKGALSRANMVAEQRPGHTPILRTLSDLYGRLAKPAEQRAVRMRLAQALRAENKPAEEKAVLAEILKVDPANSDALERMAEMAALERNAGELHPLCERLAQALSKNPQRAIAAMRRVADAWPQEVEARLRLAELLKASGDPVAYAAELQAAIEVLEARQEKDRLVDLYRELLGATPDNTIARGRLVELYRAAGKTRDAATQLLLLAKHHEDEKAPERAEEVYEQILQEEPDHEEALRAFSTMLRATGKVEAARRRSRHLAGMLAERGRRDEALELIRGLAAEDPGNIAVRRSAVDLLRHAQRFADAARELNAIAEVLRGTGDSAASLAALREAAAITPDDPEQRQVLIEALDSDGMHAEANEERLVVAEVLSRVGQPQRAHAVLEELLKEHPGNLAARRLRASIYDGMGDEKRALAEYREMHRYLSSGTGTGTRGGVQMLAPPPSSASRPAEEEEDTFPGLSLMPEYVFDNYIVGSKNNFAYATAKAVADQPGKAHNPLFLYSEVGLGKTHLLHAIANALKAKRPSIRIFYTSTEYFTSALIDAIQNNTITAFRNRHRQSDVLLLDDVQFLAGKERSQEEFFHIFNILHQDGHQIVVTSDRPPKDIAHLDMRIRSRFGQGVIVDIQPPDLETRMAILRAEAQRRRIDVPNEAVAVIAERVNWNVRELKGAFNQLMTQHELCNDELSARTANALVDKYFAN